MSPSPLRSLFWCLGLLPGQMLLPSTVGAEGTRMVDRIPEGTPSGQVLEVWDSRLRRSRYLIARAPEARSDAELAGILERTPGVEELTVRGAGKDDRSGVTDQGMALLTQTTRLKKLNVYSCNRVTDQTARVLEEVRGRQLETQPGSWLTPESLQEVVGLNQLEEVTFMFSQGLSDEALISLGKLPALRRLSLHGCEGISDQGLESLASSPTLEELDVSGCPRITDRGLRALGSLPRLRSLRLGSVRFVQPITDEGIESLVELPLETLYLIKVDLGNQALEALSRIPTLQVLSLSFSSRVSDQGVATLSRLPELRDLDLHGAGLSDVGVSALSSLPHLSYLRLIGTRVQGRGLESFGNHQGLTSLDLREAQVEDVGLEAIAGIPRLSSLDLGGNSHLSDQGLARLLRGGQPLVRLDLSGTAVTAKVLPSLGKLPSLRSLDLSGCKALDSSPASDFSPLHQLGTLHLSLGSDPGREAALAKLLPRTRIRTSR